MCDFLVDLRPAGVTGREEHGEEAIDKWGASTDVLVQQAQYATSRPASRTLSRELREPLRCKRVGCLGSSVRCLENVDGFRELRLSGARHSIFDVGEPAQKAIYQF